MENVYGVYDYSKLLFVSEDRELAQDIVLSMLEEYAHASFCREVERHGPQLALWMFQNAPKYGWCRFEIKPVPKIVN